MKQKLFRWLFKQLGIKVYVALVVDGNIWASSDIPVPLNDISYMSCGYNPVLQQSYSVVVTTDLWRLKKSFS